MNEIDEQNSEDDVFNDDRTNSEESAVLLRQSSRGKK